MKIVQHVQHALFVSHEDPWARQYWWDQWYSWIFIGGPPGRWFLGALLGFRARKRYTRNAGVLSEGFMDGSFVERPHARLVLIAAAGSLLGVFAFVSVQKIGYNQILTAERLAGHGYRNNTRRPQRSNCPGFNPRSCQERCSIWKVHDNTQQSIVTDPRCSFRNRRGSTTIYSAL